MTGQGSPNKETSGLGEIGVEAMASQSPGRRTRSIQKRRGKRACRDVANCFQNVARDHTKAMSTSPKCPECGNEMHGASFSAAVCRTERCPNNPGSRQGIQHRLEAEEKARDKDALPTILRTEKLTDYRWLNLFQRHYRVKGKEGAWLFASRSETPPVPAMGEDAVIIVPILHGEQPRLLVSRDYRLAIGGFSWGFSAGLAEPGETMDQAARRELLEETGYEIINVLYATGPQFSSEGMTDEGAVMLFASCEKKCTPARDEVEIIQMEEMNSKEVKQLLESKVPIAGPAYGVLLMFSLYPHFYLELGRHQ